MIPFLILAAIVFGVCFLVDKGFQKLFRGSKEQKSGVAVKPNKRFATMGLFLGLLGTVGVLTGIGGNTSLLILSAIVLLLAAVLIVHYLSFGIYYDEESLLAVSFGKKNRDYRYEEIREQKRYVIQGGSVIVELHMTDGSAVTVQTTMDGAYPFLDYAFARWCEKKNLDPENCDFHDPSQHRWFPESEVQ